MAWLVLDHENVHLGESGPRESGRGRCFSETMCCSLVGDGGMCWSSLQLVRRLAESRIEKADKKRS